MTVTHKKLIEVALPLEAINVASAREKSIRFGHPSTLHLWWARRPLAAARAVIFSQMVDDPSEYVDELLADLSTRRTAEKAYHARLKAWEERKVVYDKARAAGMTGASNPEPGQKPTLEEIVAGIERQRLFRILESLVLWENTNNEAALQPARDEIWRSWRRTCQENADHPLSVELFDPNGLPAFHDPFAGGGSIPLEAQRLGLESYASDLNPVAVLINKAMIEIPPRFAGQPPLNPEACRQKKLLAQKWKGAQGLAEDVRYYGKWMRAEAEKLISHLYPKVEVTAEMAKDRSDLRPYVGQNLTVIAWLWARTVKSPNPAFAHMDVPLAASFTLSTKPGKEAYVEPVIENGKYHFKVKTGKSRNEEATKNGTKLARGANFQCLMSGAVIDASYIRSEAQAGRMGSRLMAVVAEGVHGRMYLSPELGMEEIAKSATPAWKPELKVPTPCHDVDRLPMYGMPTWGDAFTPRQLVMLTTFADLVQGAREQVKVDALTGGISNNSSSLVAGGSGANAYADAVAVYLGIGVSKLTDYNASLVSWSKSRDQAVHVFGRQVLPMVWDYAEVNPFADAAGDIKVSLDGVARTIESLDNKTSGNVSMCNAQTQNISQGCCISTDPPYYDNISYADLSDYFYVWLRRSLKPIFPDLFATLAVPKAEELVATPYRHGTKAKAEVFFLNGMTQAMHRLAEQGHPAFPVTIYYAFKQSESGSEDGTVSTGWETFLDAVIRAGFAITGTWPLRTEREGRMIGNDNNALASSILLVCRKRGDNVPTATRREFLNVLQDKLPTALAYLQAGNIAPVDLAQAAIGPGMAVYTRYAQVLDAQGKPLSVRQALALINQTLDEALAEQEGDFDSDTRWALAWFEQNGFAEGEFGTADVLARAKDTSVAGMVDAGILTSGRGKVRLLKPAELPVDWDPSTDKRLTAWEMVHQLIRALEADGESGAAQLLARIGVKSETARELCYRLYTLCERKKHASEALSYNGLVQSWPEIIRLARESKQATETQATLF